MTDKAFISITSNSSKKDIYLNVLLGSNKEALRRVREDDTEICCLKISIENYFQDSTAAVKIGNSLLDFKLGGIEPSDKVIQGIIDCLSEQYSRYIVKTDTDCDIRFHTLETGGTIEIVDASIPFNEDEREEMISKLKLILVDSLISSNIIG